MATTLTSISDRTSKVINADNSSLSAASHLARRGVLKLIAAAGGGLVLGVAFETDAVARTATTDPFALSAYVRIAPDGRVLIYAKAPEFGQGIKTAFPMIVADELDAAWSDVSIEFAPINAKTYGRQTSGGSNGIHLCFTELRQAGAVCRAMLISAAAQKWRIHPDECVTENSQVLHRTSDRTLSYGALAEDAAKLPMPDPKTIPLKTRDQFKIIGTPVGSVDTPKIVAGEPMFVIDHVVPGMLYAVFEKCPAVGGRVKSANLERIRALPGVKQAFIVEGNGKVSEVMPGVAIVAESTWAALKAKSALQIEWDESNASKDSWTALRRFAQENVSRPGMETVRNDGDVDKALKSATKVIEAFYEHPFLAHATMEPRNCTAWFKGNALDIWATTQTPQEGQKVVSDMLGLPLDQVMVHQLRCGGNFGRGLFNDVMCEAAMISKLAGNIPIKLMWTREDDMRHDHFRAGGFHALTAGLDAQGKLIAWRDNALLGLDKSGKVAGGGCWPSDIPAELVPNLQFIQSGMRFDTPYGAWRAPRSNAIVFPIHSFLNEISIAAKRDHLEFLIELFGAPRQLTPAYNPTHAYHDDPLDTGRAVATMKLVAEKAGWGRKMPPRHGLGLAFHHSHNTYAAEIAEVSVDANDKLTVHKITVAVDAGLIVNPAGAEFQVQGSVIDGYSAMLGQHIDIENGRIQQTNFDSYRILRMKDAPVVEVHFVPSDLPPTGLGEPALPPVAPAIGNAIFAATGRRVRSLPLLREKFTT